MFDINVAASLHLIQISHKAGVRRFIATGTCLEYGSEAESWARIPPTAPLRPVTPYGASKASCFLMLEAFARANPIELFMGEFSLLMVRDNLLRTYGRHCVSPLLCSDFPMTTGEQICDFIPVSGC